MSILLLAVPVALVGWWACTVVVALLCGPPPGGRFGESSTLMALLGALRSAATIIQLAALVSAVFVRPGTAVTAKHRRLLPAVWASLATNSLAYWGAAYLLLTMAWLG